MKIRFQDLENNDNPHNGRQLTDRASATELLDELRQIQPPFMCQFLGDQGANLIVGIGPDYGCVQWSAGDGMPPYLMATDLSTATREEPEMVFSVGGTATPIEGRYRLPYVVVRDIVGTFVESGGRSAAASWEEF